MSIKNSVCIITGASSGIGRSLAFEMARRGAKLSLAARSADKLNELKNALQTQYQAEVLVVSTDVSDETQCENLINKTLEAFEHIDILINNAGISMRALFVDVQLKVLKQLMDVNFWGTVYCTKYALPSIIKTRGSIVGVTSIAGFHGLPARSGYSASKFAIHGFLETIRIENLKNGVHVLIAAPGFTSSNVRKSALTADGTPQGESPRNEARMMTSEQVARKIANGIRFRRRNIILSLKGKISVLFQRVLPIMLDRLFYNAMAKEPDSPIKNE
ncbi:MAG TPA: SDR family oxidoreductase [Salinivirga sp.]|uniref:SDR family oxidoreductase n=1 Tax=Salinivirga sp. TaxID=1970192 RepID=UPI002B49A542|nr:SDR family oxidoreductase [Salinivirga sp.]HKK58417.1 SDR family oxidoreductase [Salinivirga sp.]